MNTADASQEISALNLTYMLLAQKLLRQDQGAAMLRLGISREMADLLVGMSLADVIRVANSNFVLCAFRLDEQPIFRTLMQGSSRGSLQQAHLSILLAGAQRQSAPAAGRAGSRRTAEAAAS